MLETCPLELSGHYLLRCLGKLFIGWFLIGDTVLQNRPGCQGKLVVAGICTLRKLDIGEATCTAGARHRPRRVHILMKEKYSNMMIDLEEEEPEAEMQGDQFRLGNHVDGRVR